MAVEQYLGFGGLKLSAESYGPADSPGVLLIHSSGQDHRVWEGVATALAAAGRQVISLDLRGHGASEWASDGRYDLDAFVGDVRAVLAALGSRPVVVASSLGGWVATTALGEGGGHLATGLVLVDSPPRIDGDHARKVGDRMRERAAEAADHGWDRRVLDGGIINETLEPRMMAAAAALKIPTLVIRGERSPVSSRDAIQQLTDAIAGAEFVEVPDAGHMVAVDQTDAFSAVLLDFLERRVPRSAPEYRAGSDPRTLRDALGCFGTGVTVVTTLDGAGKPIGLTANSFTSVSLDPPLLLVCLAKTAGSLPTFLETEHFAVNVLHIGQQVVSGRFASKQEDRFAATPWESWDTGSPIIQNSLASFDCARDAVHDAGDHVILIGRVLRVKFEPRRDPLLFFRGQYRRLHFS